MEERPTVLLDFDGPGGNTLDLVATCVRAARRAGWPRETIENWKTEAMIGDRQHVLDMIFEHFEVMGQVVQYGSVGRDQYT